MRQLPKKVLLWQSQPCFSERRAEPYWAVMGSLNPFFGIGPGIKAVEAAAELSGTKVYVYDVNSFTLVNNKPFRSIRKAAEAMPISTVTLASKLDIGKPFKVYYYYSGRARQSHSANSST